MSRLSVIIVNYNVKFFLEQCLLAVQKATDQLACKHLNYQTEVFVVDNYSVDSSQTMVKTKFPDINLIENKSNMGFAAANNQAIRISKGDYCLLLNPDTVIEENTFVEIIEFMDANPQAGALGVKMIDGSGKFLPESKRAFPSPMTAFYKIFGFSKLFPHSQRFGKYHLSYLNEDEIHEVDVLSGAFMLLRREALDITGLLDESFFMYGEDIDLSYRIKNAGFKNYYYPKTQIIHYKGESTKKASVNYVFIFYQAMIIFARKHFSPQKASVFVFLINIAIYFRAFLALVRRFFNRALLLILDGGLIYGGLYLGKLFWEGNINIGHGRAYPPELSKVLFPLYVFLWIIALALLRNYKKPFSFGRIIKAVVLGTLFISSIYAFFEETYRFSRALILLGTLSTFIAVSFNRLLVSMISNRKFSFKFNKELRIAIIGSEIESNRILELLKQSELKFNFTGFISGSREERRTEYYLGDLSQIKEIIQIHGVNELIFCAEDISSEKIIASMSLLEKKDVVFKIAPQKSLFIIGSHSKNNTGDLYTIDIQLAISSPENRVKKRAFDIVASVLLFLASPLLIVIQKNPSGVLKNIFLVLSGQKTWVSYIPSAGKRELPQLRQGVCNPAVLINKSEIGSDIIDSLNLAYARDYQAGKDILILWKSLRMLKKN